jgi:hypothetical protein
VADQGKTSPTQTEDWVMVPRVPTEEMLEAADDAFHPIMQHETKLSKELYGKPGYASSSFSEPLWSAMLSAAPTKSLRGSDWRPIETHDGSAAPVFAICMTAYTPTPFEAWFFDGSWRRYSQPEEKASAGVTKWHPTHWMPKSSIPAAALSGGRAGPPPHWTPADGSKRHPQTAAEWDFNNDPTGTHLDRAIQRLNFASDLADPRVPSQFAQVARRDLIVVLGDYLRIKAHRELLMNRAALPPESETQ